MLTLCGDVVINQLGVFYGTLPAPGQLAEIHVYAVNKSHPHRMMEMAQDLGKLGFTGATKPIDETILPEAAKAEIKSPEPLHRSLETISRLAA